MASEGSWWRQRGSFVQEAFLRGASSFYWILGAATVIVGGSLLTASIWAFHKPRLGFELAVLTVVLMVMEGAFRLRRDSANAVADSRAKLQEHLMPRLSVSVPQPHFNSFDPPESGSGKYATIDIQTTEPVRNCRGHIRKITTEGTEIPVRAPIPLRWIAHNSLERDLVPGLSYGMTVIFTESPRPREFLISTDSHAPRGIPWALNPGITVLDVVVSADDVPNLEIALRVNASNTWNLLDMTTVESFNASEDDRWAQDHPISASLGLTAGGTGPYDDVREERLRKQKQIGPTSAGTIAFTEPDRDTLPVPRG